MGPVVPGIVAALEGAVEVGMSGGAGLFSIGIPALRSVLRLVNASNTQLLAA